MSHAAFSTGDISLEQWQTFMEYLPEISPIIDISCLLTPDHEFLCVNEGAAEQYDIEPEEFVGECCYKLVHNQDEPIKECPCDRTLETGEPMEGEVFEENGRYYIPAAAPIFGDDDDVVAIAHTIRDVTEQQRRQAAMQAHSKAMEASIDGIAILDEDGEYIYVNQAHAYIYGYDDPDSFIGESWRMCYDEDELARFENQVMPLLYQTGSWRGEATGLRKDGTPFPQELSLSLTENDQIICVVRDITEQKDRRAELERKNERLEDLASTIAHDLRNSLTVAQGRTDLARETGNRDHLDYVASSIDRSIDIVEDLLTKTPSERLSGLHSLKLSVHVGKMCIQPKLNWTSSRIWSFRQRQGGCHSCWKT
ncbi:MAG: PAS domain-containing protein [Halobacteriaceae archaeon]